MNFVKTLIVAIGILFGTGAMAAPADWKVSDVSGQVTISAGATSFPVKRGQRVVIGDTVETGRDARVVLVRDRDYIVIAAGSRLRIAPPADAGRLTQIIQVIGKAAYAINKRLTPHFEVKTPNLAAVVKGTKFDIAVTPEGCSVSVNEGRVEVQTADGGARFLAHRGDTGTVMTASRGQIDVTGTQTTTVVSPHTQPMMPKPKMMN